MKFKAKLTGNIGSDNVTWINRDRIYNIEKRNGEYVLRERIISEENLHKYFEPVEEVKKPRICEILGVEVNERFKLKSSNGNILLQEEYLISKNGYFLDEDGRCTPSIGIDTINGNFTIIKLPQYTEEEQRDFKALKVLGFGWIAKDEGGAIWAYSSKPIKANFTWRGENSTRIKTSKAYNVLKSFAEWEDAEPFEIPNIQ